MLAITGGPATAGTTAVGPDEGACALCGATCLTSLRGA
eukprot:COSAG01_NODE_43180_length_432_cov_1.360360_1_plen_37_part_01